MRFYFAYGSNLWLAQMNRRCPGHSKIGHGILPGYRWIINTHGYATVMAAENERVHGVVYTLSATDEQNLDAYEEVASGLYQKCDCKVRLADREVDCLVYIDPVTSEGRPSAAYITRINYGLRDAKLPEGYVAQTIRRFVPALSEGALSAGEGAGHAAVHGQGGAGGGGEA
jgi:gamma-glutamylcyclotransferase